MGVKKTQVKVAKQVYWVGWYKDVRYFVGAATFAQNIAAAQRKDRANFKTCVWEHHGKELR